MFEALEATEESYSDYVLNINFLIDAIKEMELAASTKDENDKINNFHKEYNNYLNRLKEAESTEKYNDIVKDFNKSKDTTNFNNLIKEYLSQLIKSAINGIKNYTNKEDIPDSIIKKTEQESTEEEEIVSGEETPSDGEGGETSSDENEKEEVVIKTIKDFFNDFIKKIEEIFYSKETTPQEEIPAEENTDTSGEIVSGESDKKLSPELLNKIVAASIKQYDLSQWFDFSSFDFKNYYYIVRYDNRNIGVNSYQIYYLNETYTKSATNNTITCYIVHNNQVYEGHINLLFTQHGTSGTDYTFSLGLGPLVALPDGITGTNGAYVDDSDAEWVEVGHAAPALTIGETAFRRIQFELYDANNEKIDLTEDQRNDIIKKWVVGNIQGFYSGQKNAENLEFLVKQKPKDKSSDRVNWVDVAVRVKLEDDEGNDMPIENLHYIVLAASIRYNASDIKLGNVNFTQLLPIHIRTKDIYYLDGSDYITYDDGGANPQFFNKRYNLIGYDGENPLSFGIVSDEGNSSWLPVLDKDNQLQPSPIYVSGLSTNVAIEAKDGSDNVLYTAPLIIIQNKYQIPALNSWNGKLSIDEKNNQVMAATIAAGKKDSNNTFTGVIMGTIEGKDVEDQAKTIKASGLYGYEKGEQAFGFLDNGTGFIGKSGTGRIHFDGNKGYIQSANYSASSAGLIKDEDGNQLPLSGTKIDLNDGFIDMWGEGYSYIYQANEDGTGQWIPKEVGKNENKEYITDPEHPDYAGENPTNLSTNIHIDVKGSVASPYFKIEVPRYETIREIETDEHGNATEKVTSKPVPDSNSRQSLIQIDKSNFYLQTADYNKTDDKAATSGLRIDLRKGVLDSKGPLTINGARGSEILFGDDTNHLQLKFGLSGSASLDLVSGRVDSQSGNSAAINLYRYGKELIQFLDLNIKKNSYLIPTQDKNGQPYFIPVTEKQEDWPEGATDYYDALSALINNEFLYNDLNIKNSEVSKYKTFSETLSRSDVRKLDPNKPEKIYYNLVEQEDGSVSFEEITVSGIKEEFSQNENLSSKTYFLKPYLGLKEKVDEWDRFVLYDAADIKVKHNDKYYKINYYLDSSNIGKTPGSSSITIGGREVNYWKEITEDDLNILTKADIEKFEIVSNLIGQQNSSTFNEANSAYLAQREAANNYQTQLNEASTKYEEKRVALNTNLSNYKLDWEEFSNFNIYEKNAVVMFNRFLYRSKVDENDASIYEDLGGTYQFNSDYWEQINPDTTIDTTVVPALEEYHNTAVENYLYILLKIYKQQELIKNLQNEHDTIEDSRKKAWDTFRKSGKKYIKDKYFTKVLSRYEDDFLNPYLEKLRELNELLNSRADNWNEIIEYLDKDKEDRYKNIGGLSEKEDAKKEDEYGLSLRTDDAVNGTFKYTSDKPSTKEYETSLELYKQVLFIDAPGGTISIEQETDGETETIEIPIYNKIWLKTESNPEPGKYIYEDGYSYQKFNLEENVTITNPSFYQDILFYYEQEETDNVEILNNYVLQKLIAAQKAQEDFREAFNKLKESWNDWLSYTADSWKKKTNDIQIYIWSVAGNLEEEEQNKINEFTFTYGNNDYELVYDNNTVKSRIKGSSGLIDNAGTLGNLKSWFLATYPDITNSDFEEANLNRFNIRINFVKTLDLSTSANKEYNEAISVQNEYSSCYKIPGDKTSVRRDFLDAYNTVTLVNEYDDQEATAEYTTALTKYTTGTYKFGASYWSDDTARSRTMYTFKPVYDLYLQRENINDEITSGKNTLTSLNTEKQTRLKEKTNLEKTIGFEKINNKTSLMSTTTAYKVSSKNFKTKKFKKGELAVLYSTSKNKNLYVSLVDDNTSKNPINGGNTDAWMKYEDYIIEKYKDYKDGTLPWLGFYVNTTGNVLTDEYNLANPSADYNYTVYELDTNSYDEEKLKKEEYYKLEISEELENTIINLTLKLIDAQRQEKALRTVAESLIGYHYDEVEKLKYSEIDENTYYTAGLENAPEYNSDTSYMEGNIVSYKINDETKYYISTTDSKGQPPIEETISVGNLVGFKLEDNQGTIIDEDTENINTRLRVLERSKEIDSRIDDEDIENIIGEDVKIYGLALKQYGESYIDDIYTFEIDDEDNLPSEFTSITIKDDFSEFRVADGEEPEVKLYHLSEDGENFNFSNEIGISFNAEYNELSFNGMAINGFFVLVRTADQDQYEYQSQSQNQRTPAWIVSIGGEDYWKPYELKTVYDEIPSESLEAIFDPNKNISAWDETVAYSKDEKVSYDGEIYISLIDNNIGNSLNNTARWALVTLSSFNDSKIYIKVSDLDTINELDEIILKKIIPTHKASANMNEKMQNILGQFKKYIDNYQSYKDGNTDETISLSSTGDIRLLIGDNFKVDKKGRITATAGTIGGWNINPNSLSSSGITINGSSLRANNGAWRINSDGTASFADVSISGGNINFGGNTWGAGGLNFGAGGIAGGVGYTGKGNYGGTLGSTFDHYDVSVTSLTADNVTINKRLDAAEAHIKQLFADTATIGELTTDKILTKGIYIPGYLDDYFNHQDLSTAINRLILVIWNTFAKK